MDVKRFCVYGDWVYGKDRFGEVDKCPNDLNAEHPHYVYASDFDRVAAERDALQLRLNAVEEENDRLRADAERYQWMKANVRNGSFGTDTGWIDDDTENWDCDIDLKRGVIQMEWDQEI